jgi:predicted amidohydrolase YtcJ
MHTKKMSLSIKIKKLSESKWPQCLSGFTFLLVFFFTSCSHKKQADLIVHNAIIYTVDSTFSNAESFAVKDGKFIAVGSNDEILNKYSAKEIIDAEGKAVYPGLIDSHCHFYGYGKGLQELDLVGTKSFDEVVKKLKKYSEIPYSIDDQDFPKWIIGRGWDQNDWAIKEYPNKKVLDSLYPEIAIFIERVDGHAALVNTAALKKAGITINTKISGGVIEVKNNQLTGILIDNAVDLVKNAIPKPDKREIKESLMAAQKNCFAVGLTTVDDAGLEKVIVDAIDSLQKDGLVKMRIYAMLTDNKENLDYYLNAGPYKTDRLDVRSFKFYADGALGSRGACLLKPYSDKPKQQGFLLSERQYFANNASNICNTNFQMNTHCIGDSAVKLILRIDDYNITYHWTPIEINRQNKRWRIEHFQVTTKEDIEKLKSSGIIPSVQPTHATSDMYWAKDRLGPERIKYAYAYNDLLKAAGMLALGTDFPVEDINPMYTFYAAVARKDLKGFPEGGFQMENALSRENTLRGMTIWGAYANFEEKEKGSIEIGKFADFVILDNDIMKCNIDSVPKTKVVYTFVNGENVYSRK